MHVRFLKKSYKKFYQFVFFLEGCVHLLITNQKAAWKYATFSCFCIVRWRRPRVRPWPHLNFYLHYNQENKPHNWLKNWCNKRKMTLKRILWIKWLVHIISWLLIALLIIWNLCTITWRSNTLVQCTWYSNSDSPPQNTYPPIQWIFAYLCFSILPEWEVRCTMRCGIKVDENWPKDLLPSFPFLKARAKLESSIMCTVKYLTDHDCKPPINTENYDKLPQPFRKRLRKEAKTISRING